MKTLFRAIPVLTMALLLAACGGNAAEPLPTLAVIEDTDTSGDTTVAADDTTAGDSTTADDTTTDTEPADTAASDAPETSDTLTVARGDVSVTVPNPGGRWQVFEAEAPGVGTLENIVSSDMLLGYTLNLTLTDKFGETLERNLRMIIGEEPTVTEENGVRFVEGADNTLYVDVNETFYATVSLTRSGDDPIEQPYIDDWREIAFNITVAE
ncbi:MAG: hypothetical protein AAFU54_16600 [Chloroflexota bacterium]